MCRRPALITLAVLPVLLMACAPEDSDTGTDATPGPEQTEPDATPDPEETAPEEAEPEEAEPDDDAAAGDVTLTLLTHDSFDVSDDVLAQFTDETGVAVEVAPSGDAGTALNQAILTQDAPQGDLLFGVDNTFLSRALDEDLFVPYESPMLEAVPDELVLDDEHRATPVDVGDVCLNYDRGWFAESGLDVPTDLADLTDDAYEGQLVVTNPATSSPGLAFLLATIERFGEDAAFSFWEDLAASDVLVTDGWSEAYYDEFSGTGVGDRPIVVSYASSPPAEVFFADPQPDEPPTGVIAESCFRQIEHVGILDGTEHEEEARLLVDFLLDVPFQEDMPLTMFVFPVNEDAELPDVFAEHAVEPDDPFEMPYDEIGAHRDEWIERWTTTVLR